MEITPTTSFSYSGSALQFIDSEHFAFVSGCGLQVGGSGSGPGPGSGSGSRPRVGNGRGRGTLSSVHLRWLGYKGDPSKETHLHSL